MASVPVVADSNKEEKKEEAPKVGDANAKNKKKKAKAKAKAEAEAK